MGPAELTLAKLNSILGGKGGEWGVEQGPTGAILPQHIRSQARELGNSGQTGAAAELLLQYALNARAPLPAGLLSEIEQNIVPKSANPAALQTTLAGLRNVVATGAKVGTSAKKPSIFSKIFGR